MYYVISFVAGMIVMDLMYAYKLGYPQQLIRKIFSKKNR